jgi:Uma2 family endonuclease
MAAPHRPPFYTPEEYLAQERQAPYKSEYIGGQIIAMGGACQVHNRITMNLARVLSTQTLNGPCETYGSDQRVKVNAEGLYTYPDLSIVCGDQQFEDAELDTLLNRTLIIEVLSPSTQRYDRKANFAYYRALSSLQEYLLIAQDQMRVEHYVRDGDGWSIVLITDPASVLELRSVNCTLPMAEIYRKVRLPAGAPDSTP